MAKKGWNIFTAGHEFFPTLRLAGCKSITVSAFLLDGLVFKGTTANWEALHKMYYTGHGPTELGHEARLLELTD